MKILKIYTYYLIMIGYCFAMIIYNSSCVAYGNEKNIVVDDAIEIQKEVDNSIITGKEIKLLPKVYNILSPIKIIKRVSIIGSGFSEDPDFKNGTVFEVKTGMESAIQISSPQARGTLLKSISWHEEQPEPSKKNWHPQKYAPLITIKDTLGAVYIENMYMPGVYSGIKSYNAGRIYINKLWGQWFDYAIMLDKSYDIDRISNIHHWTYWSSDKKVISYQQNNTNLIRLKRVDGPEFGSGIFGYGLNSLISLEESDKDASNHEGGSTTKLQIPYLTCDFTRHCLQSLGKNTTIEIGYIDEQGQDACNVLPLSTSSAIYVGPKSSVNGMISGINAEFIDQSIIETDQNFNNNYLSIGSIRADWQYSQSKVLMILHGKSTDFSIQLSLPPHFTNISEQKKFWPNDGKSKVFMPISHEISR